VTATALVLMMALSALARFYGGPLVGLRHDRQSCRLGLRVDPEQGLDFAMRGETGYHGNRQENS
jgi:hypothetical protein